MNHTKPHWKLGLALILVGSALLVPSARGQQTGQVTGSVTDESSGAGLVGVNVLVVGTTWGASTDVDGKYTINRIPVGNYDIRVSAIGYATKTVTGVVISADKPAELNVPLAQEAVNLREVVVTADEVHSSEVSVLAQRKKSSSISDGIAAEQIHRTPDATSTDALKRVTGLSIVDNKFVFVRGITDRYNETTLDGASVTSTEVGKKSFSFDLLPANLIENASVIKSATPDLPGDFSGGLVQLNTLDFPSNGTVKLSLASAYNTVTTSQDYLSSQGGSRDWLGLDDGTRAYPGDQVDRNQIARSAPNTWAPRTRKAPSNSSLSLSMGDRIELGGEDQPGSELGMIAALSYRNTLQRGDREINDLQLSRDYSGVTDETSVLWGALANVSYKFAGLHKISVKNSFNQSASDQVSQYHGMDESIPQENTYTILQWTQRSTYTGQILGEHSIPALGGLAVQWRGAVSSSRREDPDRKEVTYYRDPTDPTQPYTAAINQRSWAHLNERAYSFGTDMTLPVSNYRVKFGSFLQQKSTNYDIRYFNVTPDYFGGIPDSLTHLPLDEIYSPGNFGKGKFLFTESSKATDKYDGDQELYAGYLMFDLPFDIFTKKLRAVGGARLENFVENVNVPRTVQQDGPVSRTQLKNVDLLPSLNLTYNVTDFANVRLAYSHSVNRPEFRELASTGFYDFVTYELVGGNPELKRSFIHNYDARLEIFPDAGELFAISYFRKNISNAIEERLIQSAVRTRTWFNSPYASNTGWEAEVRKSLKFIGGYFGNFSVTANYTRIESKVQVTEAQGNSLNTVFVTSTRPLQGQAPYMINLSLLFVEPKLGTTLSILYNKFGRRLQAVGFRTSDTYEEPRDLVDVSLTRTIFGSLEGKFTLKNLGDKDRVYTRDDLPFDRISVGRTYALQVSYALQ